MVQCISLQEWLYLNICNRSGLSHTQAILRQLYLQNKSLFLLLYNIRVYLQKKIVVNIDFFVKAFSFLFSLFKTEILTNNVKHKTLKTIFTFISH
jgi:hypothetical protein